MGKRCFVLALAAIFGLSALLAAGEKKGRRRPRKQAERSLRLPAQYKQAVKLLGLKEEQVKKLSEILKARAEAERRWKKDPEKGGKVAELLKKLRSPEIKGNRQKQKEIRQQIAQLNRSRLKIRKEFEERIFKQVLTTPELRTKWRALELLRRISGRLRKIKLTEDQEKKAFKFACEVAKKLEAEGLIGKEKLSKQEKRKQAELLKELRQKILGILTSQQKAQLEKPSKEGKKGEKEKKKTQRAKKRKPKRRSKKQK